MKRVALFSTVGLAFLAACTGEDVSAPQDIDGPQLAIFDGSQGACGSGEFCESVFLFPPIVPSPKNLPDEAFNPGALANIEIRSVPENISLSGSCGSPVAFPVIKTVSESEINVDLIGERFTHGYDSGLLVELGFYRFCWFLGPSSSTGDPNEQVLLAFRDIEIVEGGAKVPRNNARQPFYQVQQGKNIPLKWTVFFGLACDEGVDCGAGLLTGTGTVTTLSQTAGVQGTGGGSSAIVITQITCPTTGGLIKFADLDLVQYGNCYDVDVLAGAPLTDVVTGACVDLSSGPTLKVGQGELLALHHQITPPSTGVPAVWEALQNVPVGFLACGTLTGAVSSNPLFRFARSVKRTLLPWLAPEPLAARDGGLGGRGSAGSPVVWALQSEYFISAGNNQSAPVGSNVPIAPAVKVMDGGLPNHQPEAIASQPVQGVTIRWQVTDPTAGSPVTSVTDVNGVATFPNSWTLEFPNDNLLEVSAYGVGDAGCTPSADRLEADGYNTQPRPNCVLADHRMGTITIPRDATSATKGSEPLEFKATATISLAAEFLKVSNAVVLVGWNDPVQIRVTLLDGTPFDGATCTITGAFTNNGTNTDVTGTLSTKSENGGICTFDDLVPTKTGALHLEAEVFFDGADNTPMTESNRFNVKTK